jgi:hypothetical protein
MFKKFLFLLLLTVSLGALAQTPPGYPPVNNHGKGVSGVVYQELIGQDFLQNWTPFTETRFYTYQGNSIPVEYPRLAKNFSFSYKGEAAQGLFVIEYDRFQGKGYLKFQIYLYWPDGSYSYFIAKDYGLKEEVYFFESDEVTGVTLNPREDFANGGAKVWKFEVINFALIIEPIYDEWLLPLEEQTRKALEAAIAP